MKRYAEMSENRASARQMSPGLSPYGMDANCSVNNEQPGGGAQQANSALARYQESGRKAIPKPEIIAEEYDVQHTYLK